MTVMEREICLFSGHPVMIITEFMHNGALSDFLVVCIHMLFDYLFFDNNFVLMVPRLYIYSKLYGLFLGATIEPFFRRRVTWNGKRSRLRDEIFSEDAFCASSKN